jgi:hypothetical protein
MEDIMKENEYLKKEVECLTETLQSVSDGLGRSVDFWRESYLELLRDFLNVTDNSWQGC